MAKTTAVFIGDGSLLLQCAGVYLDAGHEIRAIASGNEAILEWGRRHSIPVLNVGSDANIAIPDLAFDYLFSIANLRVLPQEWISRARKLAVNFHDGPLPRYAGLNATSWALMAQEPRHGITWHEMTNAVDAGRVVRQSAFEIAPAETAFTLNTRCYEAGLASFTAIVQDLSRGELALLPQQGPRSYFGRDRRPEALATLDWSRPAAQLAALVRALDFGPYPNPLGRPKVSLGAAVLLVQTAQVLPRSIPAAPGTVLSVEGDQVRVAAADADLMLGGCATLDGTALVQVAAPGAVLPTMTSAQARALSARAAQIARGEIHWSRELAAARPVALPYPSNQGSTGEGSIHRVPMALAAAGPTTVAAFFAWLAALTGQESVSVLYSDAVLAEQASGIEPWVTAWVPVTLTTGAGTSALQVVAAAEVQMAKARQAGPCPRDLPLRLGDKQPDLAGMAAIGVALLHAVPPAGFDLLLTVDPSGRKLELHASSERFSRPTVDLMARHLTAWLQRFGAASARVAEIPLTPAEEIESLAVLNDTGRAALPYSSIHQAVSAQVARTGSRAAVVQQGRTVSYQELEQQTTAMAGRLRAAGVRPGDVVGLCLERTPELVVSLLAILKAGAAYLPLDPAYPRDRLAFMIADSGTRRVVTSMALADSLGLSTDSAFLIDGTQPDDSAAANDALPHVSPDQPAYVIYTSGSTGRPKGVVVTHASVLNFFAGMGERVPHEPPGRWLAVTSLSFDISVLELCWTLTCGFTVALYAKAAQPERDAPAFSLFYFASDSAGPSADRYKLLLEGAKFADREGFSAIWTPERHFHAFGGLYPNAALTSAAIAAITTRLQIRAGSCVLPLHHPIRVAEEWSFVDNISQGRVGVSFAAGWQPNDFAIAPAAFADRKNGMLANIEVVRRLWRGESVEFPGPLGKPVAVQTLPRPIQKELPVWLTAAGNPETFQQAGALGCHLLTHLLGQTIEDVAGKIALYRQAWRQAGHAGDGHVTLMLHTFVGPDADAVRETVRGPMKEYLRSSVDLIRQAAWSFPTFVQRGAADGRTAVEIMDSAPLSPEEMDALLEHAFARYYGTSGLFGTPERCMAIVDKLSESGVDEIACLIDFGIATDTVLAHLQHLKGLMDACGRRRFAPRRTSVADEIASNAITHLQCTPSMAAMLVADAPGRAALARLDALLVGGEALPLELARELRSRVPGSLLNMYGPTETTVWSTTASLGALGDFVPLGQPIANTRLSIRSAWDAECPIGVPGELLIGGAGVSAGYWERPELNAQRFVVDAAGKRWYRTGDRVRRHSDGSLEFLGRIDHQVKIRGHRIELGEIENALARQEGVAQAVVIARQDAAVDAGLVAYVTAHSGARLDPDTLQRALAQALPEVMVPSTVMVLSALPLTPNGKVDRHALPAPQREPPASGEAAPQGELENTIAAIWCEVLGLTHVDTTENFFDLGGHSLLVVQVQRRLREVCGQEISITDMFRLTTIRALATHLGGNAASSAVDDGLNRARARRLLRSRASANPVAAA